jgi:hypothetical protein
MSRVSVVNRYFNWVQQEIFMEYIETSPAKAGINIEGFPDAVKVIAIDGGKAKRLADLSLHKADLDFSDECLDVINTGQQQSQVIRKALWHSAITHFMKCFGRDVRFQLEAKKIYKDEPPEAMMAFEYFKNLRHKHIVHDENSYAQSIPGAILNDGSKSYSVEKIICFEAFGDTLVQNNFRNLQLLVKKAREWVICEFDILCNRLTLELEKEDYSSLLEKKEINYSAPSVDDIGVRR